MRKTQRRLLNELRWHARQTPDQLACAMIRTPRTIRDTLNPLIAQGLVKVETVYSLTETGRQTLKVAA